MKNYLVFGTVAILSFLACIYFLSPSGLYGTAAAANIQPANTLVNHLTSSISLATALSTAETTEIISTDSIQVIKTDSITLNSESGYQSTAMTIVELKPKPARPTPLLKAPEVNISSEMLASDTVDNGEAEEPGPARAFAPIITNKQETGTEHTSSSVLMAYKEALLKFANEYDYSQDVAFLINLGMKSGKKRFYVINLKTGEVLNRGLVAHGQGKENFTLNKSYSNKPGSGCSSLGIYKVGGSYYGGYGKSFRLTGLEKSNSNALRRSIVLHAMNCIPDHEIDYPICQSEGCPSLSMAFLNELSSIIKSSKKPILLWIFDPAVDAGENQ